MIFSYSTYLFYTFFPPRAWRITTEMPTVLVQICKHFLDLGLQSLLVKSKTYSQFNCDGPICWSGYYYLHCFKYIIYGHGTLSNDTRIQSCAFCWKPGKSIYLSCNICLFFLVSKVTQLCYIIKQCNFIFLSMYLLVSRNICMLTLFRDVIVNLSSRNFRFWQNQ